MNIEMTDLDMILNHLETTSLEPHDDYTSEFTYKEQKKLYNYIKNLQKENQELKNQQKEFIKYLEDESKEVYRDGGLRQNIFKQVLQKYKNILDYKDEQN